MFEVFVVGALFKRGIVVCTPYSVLEWYLYCRVASEQGTGWRRRLPIIAGFRPNKDKDGRPVNHLFFSFLSLAFPRSRKVSESYFFLLLAEVAINRAINHEQSASFLLDMLLVPHSGIILRAYWLRPFQVHSFILATFLAALNRCDSLPKASQLCAI